MNEGGKKLRLTVGSRRETLSTFVKALISARPTAPVYNDLPGERIKGTQLPGVFGRDNDHQSIF